MVFGAFVEKFLGGGVKSLEEIAWFFGVVVVYEVGMVYLISQLSIILVNIDQIKQLSNILPICHQRKFVSNQINMIIKYHR